MIKLTEIGISSFGLFVTLVLIGVECVNGNASNHDEKLVEYKPQVQGSYSKYAQLTTDDDTYQGFASVTLIDSDNNEITDSQWQCTMPSSADELCVYLTINDTCSGESTIAITVDGTISGDVDLFSIFSYQDNDGSDRYLSFLNDWDGIVNSGDGTYGGVFMAPYCGKELFTIDDIFTLIDDPTTWGSQCIRYEPAGGNLSNYELLTSTRVGSASEITFYLINDRIGGTTSVYFSTASLTSWVGCAALGDEFLYGSPITVNFFSDQTSTTVGFSSFTVELECEVPTPSPTTEAVCDDQDSSYSKYAQLTTDDDTYEGFASVTLIDNDNNEINDSQWQCTMPSSGESMCVYLTINDTCDCESTISITIDGTISGDVDLFSIFSYQDNHGSDRYLSFLNDWDGYVAIGDGRTGGVFMAPYCGEELFTFDDIFTLLDDVTLYSNAMIRYEPADGDTDNYELLSSTSVGSASEITFYLINDRIAGTTSVYFSTATITSWVGCAALGDEFLYGSPITVNFFSDHISSTVGFNSFTVELECNAPTNSPTPIPTPSTPSPTKEAVCDYEDSSFSKYAQLTTDDDTYEGFASVTLIDNDNNEISDSQWQCTMPTSGESMCVYLTINDTCDCESTISITIDGTISGDVDLFSIFSYQDNHGSDRYLSFLNDWDGYVAIGDGRTGGVFMAPYCGEELFTIDDIFTLLDDVTLYSNAMIRYEPADGDTDNYELLSSTSVGSASEITFYLINDRIGGTTSVYFSTASITSWVGCAALGDEFLYGSPITVNFFSDHVSSTVGFNSFTVGLECNAPTNSPTSIPTSSPTGETNPPTGATLSPTPATPSPTASPTNKPTSKKAVCNHEDSTYSKYAELTTDNDRYEGFASITLIDNDNNQISDSQWQCTMPSSGESMCVYLSINDTCDCESVIKITVEGEISGDVDLFSVFSYEEHDGTDRFVSFLNDWDGYVAIGDGRTGGVFMAPYCGEELFSIDDIFTLLDDVSLYSGSMIRYEPAGGDSDNWELLTSTSVGSASPITLYLLNDRILNITSLYFSTETITTWVGCAVLGNQFLYGSEIIVNWFSDHVSSTVSFDKFTVELECNAPTNSPTSVPTNPPTGATPSPTKEAVCDDQDSSYSKYAQLTTDDDTYEGFASVTLIDNDNNEISDSQWQCTMPTSGESMCVYLTINDTCDCESTISITIDGTISGDVDLFSIFSYQDNHGSDRYLSFLNDWDGYVAIGDGRTGGVFMAPYCGEELFTIDDIFTLLDDVTLYSNAMIRYEPADGDTDNYELLSSTSVGSASEITFYLINDRIAGTTSVYFSTATITSWVGCAALGDEFLYGSPITVNFFSDHVSSTVGFNSFRVGLECNAPTNSPTSRPTISPTPSTPSPTLVPTISPSEENIYCIDGERCCSSENLRGKHVFCRSYYGCENTDIEFVDSCYCTGDSACDGASITSSGGNNNGGNGNVYCSGNYGCKNTNIDSITTFCSGNYGCEESTIYSSNKLVGSAFKSCAYTTIEYTPIIHAKGDLSFYQSEIKSSQLSSIDIYASGADALNGTSFTCSDTSECNVYCEESSSCGGLIFNCATTATCSITCDDSCSDCPEIVYYSVGDEQKMQQMDVRIQNTMFNNMKNNIVYLVLLLFLLVGGSILYYFVKQSSDKKFKYQLIPDPRI